jgi:3-hydroxyisobutyrate dehydrogenase-like beta-hydroxyacid dehydrogenase
MTTIGLLHPGEMGAAIGTALRQRGHEVLWTSTGRTKATATRAAGAGLVDAGSLTALAERSDVIISVCPPHAATEVAGSVAGAAGLFVDANAIAPDTARGIAAGRDAERFVDGGIIGPPPRTTGTTRLYLSGLEAHRVAELFDGTPVDARVVSTEIGAASALKMTYAAWTKGTAALLLAIRAVAETEGVAGTLSEEWHLSLPELPEAVERAARAASAKGWRWIGEMEEIAATFAASGQPDGFHRAAAEIYRGT